MTSDASGPYPNRTWQEHVWPTAEQYADWVARLSRAQLVELSAEWLRNGQEAETCFVRNHEQRIAELEGAVHQICRRHPTGAEEPGPLAPGLWCPGCGAPRADNGYGACPDRAALFGVR